MYTASPEGQTTEPIHADLLSNTRLGQTPDSDCIQAAMEQIYNSRKHAHQAREADDLRIEMRKKALLILIYQHLMGQGYVATAAALEQEMNGGLKKFEVCENVDLEMVLMEYESYQYVKFQKYPKLIKKVVESVLCQGENRNTRSGGNKRAASSAVKPLPKIQLPNLGGESRGNATAPLHSYSDDLFGLSVCPIASAQAGGGSVTNKVQMPDSSGGKGDSEQEERLLKPLSGFSGMSGDMTEFATIINKYPQLFTGLLSPWKGLLLYGPPGTGKTLLAKAVATECKTTFFNISASSIVRKWRGDSEKLVRVLFELARYHAPSTIFLDEVDSMMGQRGSSIVGEHESSRRLKAELLVQMDGVAKSDELIFVLAASNLPWELDQGLLRRLEKRILVGLPPAPARQAMIAHWLPPNSTGELQLKAELDYQLLANEMKGYSGSDIRLVCKEAAMRQARKIFEALESNQAGRIRQGDTGMLDVQLETVTTQDFLEVLAHTKPSVSGVMDKHTAWEKDFESV
ncbi:katanin p60 ATPase-containing subunit A-like 2 isoform X2 [Phyllopteryx taeniolatus]|uniref:katanin p60 ATPase-containing subunit A-like 2 isoform X2 n=1 Tax=Phyllopteryx taeniolatus TaxID=161469 RepID=UPI002AD41795|nr:katanin p60 ATPase-containing subunit A-like 2 isoform X2 [Phyllopteryx taeniolatus]